MIKTIESIKPIEIDNEKFRMVFDDDNDSPCSKCDLFIYCKKLSNKNLGIYNMLCVECGEEFKEKTGKYPYFLKIKVYKKYD